MYRRFNLAHCVSVLCALFLCLNMRFDRLPANEPPVFTMDCEISGSDLMYGDIGFLHVELHNRGEEPATISSFRADVLVGLQVMSSGLPTGPSLVVPEPLPEGFTMWNSLKIPPGKSKDMLLMIRVLPSGFHLDGVFYANVSIRYEDDPTSSYGRNRSIAKRIKFGSDEGIFDKRGRSSGLDFYEVIHGYKGLHHAFEGKISDSKGLVEFAEFPFQYDPKWSQVAQHVSSESTLARLIKLSAACKSIIAGEDGIKMGSDLHVATLACANRFERTWIQRKLYDHIRHRHPIAAVEFKKFASRAHLWQAEIN